MWSFKQLETYRLSRAQPQIYQWTGEAAWLHYHSEDPCSSSAIHQLYNPPIQTPGIMGIILAVPLQNDSVYLHSFQIFQTKSSKMTQILFLKCSDPGFGIPTA